MESWANMAPFCIIEDLLVFTAAAGFRPNCHGCQGTTIHNLLGYGFILGEGRGEEDEKKLRNVVLQTYQTFLMFPYLESVGH